MPGGMHRRHHVLSPASRWGKEAGGDDGGVAARSCFLQNNYQQVDRSPGLSRTAWQGTLSLIPPPRFAFAPFARCIPLQGVSLGVPSVRPCAGSHGFPHPRWVPGYFP